MRSQGVWETEVTRAPIGIKPGPKTLGQLVDRPLYYFVVTLYLLLMRYGHREK